MKKVLRIALILLGFITTKGQTLYTNFSLSKEYIWGLTLDGNLNLFEKISGKHIDKKIPKTHHILFITRNKLGDIIIVTENKEILKYNEQLNTWEFVSKIDEASYGVVFDTKNNSYSLTNKGIEETTTHHIYFSDSSLNHQLNFKDSWGKPYCFYIDKRDIIWVGFGHGEWGGNLFVFDTKSKAFLVPKLDSFEIELFPIKSFFEDSSSLYLSAGIQHMSTSGTIVRFDGLKACTIINSESHWSSSMKTLETRVMIPGEYIGPATFNPFNNSIYFYSQNGFFRGSKSKELSDLKNWELVSKPRLKWVNGQPDAVGSPMNVLKLEILDKNRFVFLSQNDGIGLFDGEKTIMLN